MRLIGVLALVSLSAFAHAEVEAELKNCAMVQDNQQRLACYDKVSANIATVISSVTPITKVNETKVSQTHTQAKLTVPVLNTSKTTEQKISEFGAESLKTKEKTQAVEKIYLEVAKIKKNPYGDQTFYFTNGQVWKQTESRRFRIKKGAKVFIEKAALGSFLLSSDNRNTSIRVKRLK